jgi:hypothetical protein
MSDWTRPVVTVPFGTIAVRFGKVTPRELLNSEGVSPRVVIQHPQWEREDFKPPNREKPLDTPMTTSLVAVDTETMRVRGMIKPGEGFPQKTPFEVFIHRLPSNMLATVTLAVRSLGGTLGEKTVHLQRPSFGEAPWRVLSQSKKMGADTVTFVKDQVMKAVDTVVAGLENRELQGTTYGWANRPK